MINESESLRKLFETIRDERKTHANTATRIGEAFLALLSYMDSNSWEKYLRKDTDDTNNGHTLTVGELAAQKRARFGEFITRVSGGLIDSNGDAELNSLVLRSRLFVPVIAYNEIDYFRGMNAITPGGGCSVLSFVANTDGSYTVMPDAEEVSFAVDDILTASYIQHSDDGRFAGFELMKFRVTAVDTGAKTFTIVPKPGETWKPANQMNLAQTGTT